jgi:hypothetical protein
VSAPSFEDTLADCLARIRQGKDLDDVEVEGDPAWQARLESYIAVADVLVSARPYPTPDFERRARTRFLEAVDGEIASQWAARGRFFRWLARRRRPGPVLRGPLFIVAVVLVVVALFVVAGRQTARAAETALPDSPFYAVKRAMEETQAWMPATREDQVRRCLKLARRRADELQRASAAHKPPDLMVTLLQQLDDDLTNAVALSMANDIVSNRLLDDALRGQLQVLASLAPSAQGSALTELATVQDHLRQYALVVQTRLGTPAPDATVAPTPTRTPQPFATPNALLESSPTEEAPTQTPVAPTTTPSPTATEVELTPTTTPRPVRTTRLTSAEMTATASHLRAPTPTHTPRAVRPATATPSR